MIAAIAVIVLAWSVFSGYLARHNLTGPLLFMVVGYLIANPDWGLLSLDLEAGDIDAVAQITLALVLFADASRVNVGVLRHDIGLPLRLLGIGLPLVLLAGAGVALVMFDGMSWQLALFLGAALAPTDAALSVQVIDDERVPMRLRRALNVESGLNDGIATPVVSLALALAATAVGLGEGEAFEAGAALRELGFGVLAGLVVGFVGAAGINLSSSHRLAAPSGRRLAALATALASFGLALTIGGNGFIAAFVAGIVFGFRLDTSDVGTEDTVELPDLGGEVLALVVWFLFGAGLVPFALRDMSLSLLLYALLSLTLIRILPVAVSTIGTGLPRRDVIFLGWFGPRGLASVVFALLAIEQFDGLDDALGLSVSAVVLTVLLSVVLHGITAGPAGRIFDTPDGGQSPTDDGTQPRPRASRVVTE